MISRTTRVRRGCRDEEYNVVREVDASVVGHNLSRFYPGGRLDDQRRCDLML